MELFTRQSGGRDLVMHLATTEAERQAIFKFRYQQYSRQDLLANEVKGPGMYDAYDFEKTTMLFYMQYENQMVGTVRNCIHQTALVPTALSLYEDFPEAIEREVRLGQAIVESGRMTTAADLPKLNFLPLYFLRNGLLNMLACNATCTLGGIKKKHFTFYKRVFDSVSISGEEPMAGLKGDYILVKIPTKPYLNVQWFRRGDDSLVITDEDLENYKVKMATTGYKHLLKVE